MDEFRAKNRKEMDALFAGDSISEEQMKAYRELLDATREQQLAAGRNHKELSAKLQQKKEKKKRKKEKKKKKKKAKAAAKSKGEGGADGAVSSSSSSSSDSESESEDKAQAKDDTHQKFRLSNFHKVSAFVWFFVTHPLALPFLSLHCVLCAMRCVL